MAKLADQTGDFHVYSTSNSYRQLIMVIIADKGFLGNKKKTDSVKHFDKGWWRSLFQLPIRA